MFEPLFERFMANFLPDGSMKTSESYQEIIRLHDMLTADNVPHTFRKLHDGWQVSYPCHWAEGERVCSAVQHRISYGHENDLLEIMGLLTAEEEEDDNVLGWLTADDVYLRIISHYQNTQEAARVEKEEQ